jgi:hypothetical protein
MRSIGAAGVTAGAAAVLAALAIRSSYGQRRACRRSNETGTRGGIAEGIERWTRNNDGADPKRPRRFERAVREIFFGAQRGKVPTRAVRLILPAIHTMRGLLTHADSYYSLLLVFIHAIGLFPSY